MKMMYTLSSFVSQQGTWGLVRLETKYKSRSHFSITQPSTQVVVIRLP